MDIITALSVASAVARFVDFGSKLISNPQKLYGSSDDASRSTVDVENIRSDLESITQGLQRRLSDTQLPSSTRHTSSPGFKESAVLGKLCMQCIEISKCLLAQLEKLVSDPKDMKSRQREQERIRSLEVRKGLKEQGKLLPRGLHEMLGADGSRAWEDSQGRLFSTWGSFRRAFVALWSNKEIEELRSTLRECRGEIEYCLLILFRQILQDSTTARQATMSQQRVRSTQVVINAFLNTRETFASQLQAESKKLLHFPQRSSQAGTEETDEVKAKDEGRSNHIGSSASRNEYRGFPEENLRSSSRERQIEQEMRLLIIENSILSNLSFATLADRREGLGMPHGQTFEWIYEQPEASRAPWSNFSEWLQTGDSIYWIQGRLGSGKSTLMRYIFENEETRLRLCLWTQGSPIEILAFYFWNSGDENQKSMNGLLRSLLFDLLERYRGLLSIVLPDVWDTWSARATRLVSREMISDSNPLLSDLQPLSSAQLEQWFHDLLTALPSGTKLCFFLDGLDECDEGHSALISFVQKYSLLPGIKFCLSSRPLSVFEQAYTERPGLRLQDLTRGDINHYVQSQLLIHKHMERISEGNTDEISRLTEKITLKANGVFLWVKLVVKYLLGGLSDRDSISELELRAEDLPEDIEALYAHILEHISPSYREQACRIFQIFRAAQKTSSERVTLLNLSWADDQDEALAEHAPIRPLAWQEILTRCQTMDGRLRTVCAGLLESSNSQWSGQAPDAKVAFLHRSVADWLATREVWEGIQSYTSGFSPNLSMLKSRILNLKAVLVTPGNPLDMTLASDALWYAKEAERDLDSGFPKLLDEFDKVVSFLWRMGYHGDTAYDPHTTGLDAFEGISAATSQPITMLAPSYRNSSTWTADWDDTKFRGSRLPPAAHAGLLGPGMDTFDEVESMVMRRNFLGSSSLTGLAPQGLRGNTLYHWTYAVDLPGIKPVGKASTFYDVVKALGLDHYVRMKCESGTIMDQDVSQHLLIQAITSTTTNSANVASVIRLLESGADPNIPYNGQAAWEYAMTNALSHLKRAGEATHSPDAEWERKAKAWISIFSAFVAHGADPEAVVRRPIGLQGPLFLDASDIIDKYLSYVLSDEAVALKLVLAKTRNSSRDH